MRRIIPRLLLLAALSACRQPRAREFFLRANDSGEYSFSLDLSDTLAAYDISFYTALDRPPFHRDTLVCFPMQIVWRSPSGRYFSETVYYPADSVKARYRTGLIPSEYGDWTVAVTLPSQPASLRGLGIICERR